MSRSDLRALWANVVLVVAGRQLRTFYNGVSVPDADYGFPMSVLQTTQGNANRAGNVAYPSPGCLGCERETSQTVVGMSPFHPERDPWSNPIYVGGKPSMPSDGSEGAFTGRMAALVISHYAMDSNQVACFYHRGETLVPTLEELKTRK